MNSKPKRLLALLLTLAMVFSMMSAGAWAAEPEDGPAEAEEVTEAEEITEAEVVTEAEEPTEAETAAEEPSEVETAAEEPAEAETAAEEPSEVETAAEEPTEAETVTEEPAEAETVAEEPTEAEELPEAEVEEIVTEEALRDGGSNAATPTISALPTATPLILGQTLSSSTLSGGTAEYAGSSVEGSFEWLEPALTPGSVSGNTLDTFSVQFTPNDLDHYTSATCSVPVLVLEERVLEDGETLSGEIGPNTRILIADGATVTLNGVDITRIPFDNAHPWPGITCLGDATIVLSGENTVMSGSGIYAGIQAGPVGTTLTIRGGASSTLSAGNLGNGAAGIGASTSTSTSCGNIVIEGGDITAYGGGGAAIGGGIGNSQDSTASCGDITISGGTVTASGMTGIGAGQRCPCGDITISTSGSVTATGTGGCGIGSNFSAECGNIAISNATVTASSMNGAGIGASSGTGCGDITISSGNVTASNTGSGAGIGAGPGKGGTYRSITISGGTVKASGSAGAGIGGGAGNTADTPNGPITISGGTVEATSQYNSAGIGAGPGGVCADITISGDAILSAKGGAYGAGIGAGYSSTCGDITISGGTIQSAAGGKSAAGIGSGYSSTCGDITISGGAIQSAAGGYQAAGIGSGFSSTCGDITITGGTIQSAKGGDGGAGIGSGYTSTCGDITIAKTVTALTAEQGAELNSKTPATVGAGVNGSCTGVRIDGVEVTNDAVTETPFYYTPVIVTLDANGGTVTHGGAAFTEVVLNRENKDSVGWTAPLPTDDGYVFTPASGYEFAAWNPAADGSGADCDGALTLTGHTTLYVRWLPLPATAPGITAQAQSISRPYGGEQGIGVTAEAASDSAYTLSYQWYACASDGSGGEPVAGATESVFTLPKDRDTGAYSFYCVVTATRTDNGKRADTQSDVATVTVYRTDSAPAVTANTLTYSGAAQPLVTLSGQSVGGPVRYALGADNVTAPADFADAVPTAVRAGTYYVWYQAAESRNYNASDVFCLRVDITPKTVGLRWTDTKFTYDGQRHVPTAAATGLLDGDTCTVTVSGAQVKAGKHTATASKLSNANYTLPDSAARSFTIAKASQKAPVAPVVRKTTASSITVKTVRGQQYRISGSGKWQSGGTFQNLKAGKQYTIYTRIAAKGNYAASPASKGVKTRTLSAAMAMQSGTKIRAKGNAITVQWGKAPGAKSYEVYVAYCGEDFAKTPTATVKGTSVNITKIANQSIDTGRNYKLYIVAKDGGKVLGKTTDLHGVASGRQASLSDATSVSVSKTSLSLKKGGTANLGARTAPQGGQLSAEHGATVRYATSDSGVATVDRNGAVRAKAPGVCTIQVITLSGLTKNVTVTVK